MQMSAIDIQAARGFGHLVSLFCHQRQRVLFEIFRVTSSFSLAVVIGHLVIAF